MIREELSKLNKTKYSNGERKREQAKEREREGEREFCTVLRERSFNQHELVIEECIDSFKVPFRTYTQPNANVHNQTTQ